MTPKQQRFVDEYLLDGNATRAAECAGYSVKAAAEIGYENLRKPHIATAIAERMAQDRERCEITKDSVTEMLREDRQLAIKCKQSGAAVTASMGIAKLHGLIVDKSEATVTRVTRQERLDRVSELLERSGVGRASGAPGSRESGNGAGKPH